MEKQICAVMYEDLRKNTTENPQFNLALHTEHDSTAAITLPNGETEIGGTGNHIYPIP
jgi:hypothetical protein